MASVEVAKLSPAEKEQLSISYATFILSGTKTEVSKEKLEAVLKAADVKVNANLITAVTKALKGKDVSSFIGGIGGGSSSSAPQPAADTKKPAAKKDDKPAPPPPEEEEEMDMGGIFD